MEEIFVIMEHKGSSCSRKPTMKPYFDPQYSNSHLCKIDFDTTFPSAPKFYILGVAVKFSELFYCYHTCILTAY